MQVNFQDNRTQNNIMAASTAICAGTAGAITGAACAPRAAKNMEELLSSSPDVFFKTIDNIQNTKSLDAFSKTWSLITAKGFYDSLEIRLNNAFPGDKIPVNDFKQQLAKQEKYIKTAGEKINGFIDGIVKKNGHNMSLEEYFKEIVKRDILPENLVKIAREDIINIIGEDGYKAPNPINDETIDMFKSSRDIAINITNKEISLYKNLIKVEKNGILHKKDMVEAARNDIKPIISNMLHDISFNSLKKFVPQTGKTKWALITGGVSSAIAAAGVKLFGNKN